MNMKQISFQALLCGQPNGRLYIDGVHIEHPEQWIADLQHAEQFYKIRAPKRWLNYTTANGNMYAVTK